MDRRCRYFHSYRWSPVDEGIWIVSFMQYDLGYIDLEQKTLQPWTTRSARGCRLCLRYDLLPCIFDYMVLRAIGRRL